ncbi:MAG: TonB-dependent receptor [Rhodospirillaceae bacterium]|nr:TonB-dependent receptor [Rhodospirillaceae bacterium]
MMRAAAVAAVVSWSAPVLAQSAAQPPEVDAAATEGGVTVYDQAFFAAYNVLTAKDMLDRIPGMTGVLGNRFQDTEERRGMRSDTDQVLINGRRSTGKDTDVSDYLERLPANQVVRIEVISGNVKQIDSAISGRVVNIVLKSDDAGSGSGAYALGAVFFMPGQVHPSGNISYNYTAGPLGFTIGLESLARFQLQKVNDRILNPAGAPIARQFENRNRERPNYTGRSRFTYAFDGGTTVQLSAFGLYAPYDDNDNIEFFRFTPGGETRLSAIRDITEGRERKFEITSDVTVPLGAKSKLLGFAVYSDNSIRTDSEIFNFAVTPEAQTGGDGRDEHTVEKIVRGTFQRDIGETQKLEIGVEGAITTLDKDLDFFSIVGGRRVDLPVFNSDTRITEDRAEVFSSYTFKPTPGLEIEPGLAAEFSKLSQRGNDITDSRSLHYIKPSLNVWYNIAPTTRLFGSFVRDVGQLRFEDFAASFIREDDEVVAGNPNLVPEKAWAFELGVEHRLADNAGLVQLRGFYKRVNDVNDEVPLGPLISGPGNLGSGDTYGGQVEWSFKLASFDLFDAVFSGSYLLQDSKVTDAFTGRSRRFGKQPTSEWKMTYQQDIRSIGTSFGFEFNRNGPSIESDFSKFDRNFTQADLRIFIEQDIGYGLIFRTLFGNVLNAATVRDRVAYAVSQADGRVLQTENRRALQKEFITLRLRGTF